MAKAPVKAVAKTAPKAGAKTSGKGGKSAKGNAVSKALLLPVLLLLVGSAFILPFTIIAFAGGIPALVTLMTDRSRAKSLSVCVGSLNLAGIAYILGQVFERGAQPDYAMHMLQVPMNWVIMWGGAGLGLALHTLVPPVVAQFLTALSEGKIKKIRANQNEIRKIWGEEVKGQ